MGFEGIPERIMWLKVASSNNNPVFITKYFWSCIQEVGGKILGMYGIMSEDEIIFALFNTLYTNCPRMYKVIMNRYGNRICHNSISSTSVTP